MHPRARHRVDAQYIFSEQLTKGTQVILKVTKDGKGSVEFGKAILSRVTERSSATHRTNIEEGSLELA